MYVEVDKALLRHIQEMHIRGILIDKQRFDEFDTSVNKKNLIDRNGNNCQHNYHFREKTVI